MLTKRREAMNDEISTGSILDVSFSNGKKIIETSGCVTKISGDAIVVNLKTTDKNMTLSVGADIFIFVSKEAILFSVRDTKDFPEIRIEKVKSRSDVRVDDILKIDYKKISRDNYEKHQSTPGVVFAEIFGNLYNSPELEEVNNTLLYELLYQTNLKLDRILDILEGKNGRKYRSTDYECVNISGSGMRFNTEQEFEAGDIVALRVPLHLVCKTHLNLLGKVRSVKETDTLGKYNISVTFIDIAEDVREKIIKYIFKKQRELLRETKK